MGLRYGLIFLRPTTYTFGSYYSEGNFLKNPIELFSRSNDTKANMWRPCEVIRYLRLRYRTLQTLEVDSRNKQCGRSGNIFRHI